MTILNIGGACCGAITVISFSTIAMAALHAGDAHAADTYPTRPIRVVVATAPGGGTDAVTRILGARAGEALGQQWVVDNRAGAGGNLGGEIVARAAPDGYTLLAATSTLLTVNPTLYPMSFSVDKDLQPIIAMGNSEQVVVVHPSVPANTLAELVALAKLKPGALNYASAGVGTAVHLGAALLNRRAGISMIQVPYKGGGPATAAALAGEVQVVVGTITSTINFIHAGRLRALATTGPKRSLLLPEVPTVAESGYPGFDAGVWYSLLAPSATPMAITERLRAEVAKALQLPEVQTTMARQALEPVAGTPAELKARIRKETVMWAGLLGKTGVGTK